jgi:GT2 family glycosyltransferase
MSDATASPPAESGRLPRVSAIVLAWKAEPLLRRSVESLLASAKADVEVVIVDNGCTTDDVEVLSALPGVVVVGEGNNLGFSGGCNLGVTAASGEYVALVNGDAVVEPTTLARLVEELGRPDVGIAAGAIRLADEPDLLNSRGNEVHVLGVSWVGGFRERETRSEPTDTPGAMGACLVTSRAHWDRLGGFDHHYFAYHEDAELSIRTWRLGLRVVNVPDAVALHRYEFSRNSFKYYLVERNRLMFVATLWGRRSLWLLAPALLALEGVLLLLALKEGWLPDKLRGYGWLWRHRGHLRERRRMLQAERIVPDRQWMSVLADRFDTPLIDPPGVRVLNALMTSYWRLVRRWV